MYIRILAILLDIGIIFAAGVWLCWVGIMPVKIGPEKLAAPPDSGINWFRMFARFMGPLVILGATWQMAHDIHRMVQPSVINWQMFKSSEGRFEIELPAEPERSSSETGLLGGAVTEYKFKADTSEGELTFVVSYLDCPPLVKSLEPRTFLENELTSRVQSAQVRLLKKSDATIDNCPAIYFSMDATVRGIRVEGYLVLDHLRLYQMGAQYVDERSESSRKRYFESFRRSQKQD